MLQLAGEASDQSIKKVLIVVTLSEHGGAQSYVKWLAMNLPREKFFVSVACAGGGELVDELQTIEIPVFIQPNLQRALHPWRDILATLDLYRLIRKIRPDIIHLNSSKAGIVGRIAAALAGVPAVFTAHGWAFSEGVPGFNRWIALLSEWLVAPLTRQIICVSVYDLDLAKRYRVGQTDQLIAIPNGLADNKLVSDVISPLPNDLVQVVMVARFTPQKQHEKVIRAFKDVRGAVLLLVGDGPLLEQSRQLIKSLGIDDKIFCLGNRDDVPAILAHSHIFVLSSAWEGLPISILEAMRAGLPIVASATAGISEMVQTGLNGFVGPKEEYVWMTDAIQSLVDDADLRGQMGGASRQIFLKKFTIDKMSAKTVQVYNSILSS